MSLKTRSAEISVSASRTNSHNFILRAHPAFRSRGARDWHITHAVVEVRLNICGVLCYQQLSCPFSHQETETGSLLYCTISQGKQNTCCICVSRVTKYVCLVSHGVGKHALGVVVCAHSDDIGFKRRVCTGNVYNRDMLPFESNSSFGWHPTRELCARSFEGF